MILKHFSLTFKKVLQRYTEKFCYFKKCVKNFKGINRKFVLKNFNKTGSKY